MSDKPKEITLFHLLNENMIRKSFRLKNAEDIYEQVLIPERDKIRSLLDNRISLRDLASTISNMVYRSQTSTKADDQLEGDL